MLGRLPHTSSKRVMFEVAKDVESLRCLWRPFFSASPSACAEAQRRVKETRVSVWFSRRSESSAGVLEPSDGLSIGSSTDS